MHGTRPLGRDDASSDARSRSSQGPDGYVERYLKNRVQSESSILVTGKPIRGMWAAIAGIRLGPATDAPGETVPVHISTAEIDQKSTYCTLPPVLTESLPADMIRVYAAFVLADGTETHPFEIELDEYAFATKWATLQGVARP